MITETAPAERAATVRITIVYDNTTLDERCPADHGFACVVDAHGLRVLFDTGASGDILLRNMTHLGLDPASVDRVFISHPHWDHAGGLEALLDEVQVPVYLPASAEPPGDLVEQLHRLSGPATIAPGLHSTGEMPAVDYPLHEHSLIVDAPGGSVVVVGCAHPGVGRILGAAAERGPVRALVGGLHGFLETDLLAPLALVCPAHCTKRGDEIRAAWPDKVVPAGVGRVLEI